MIHFGFLQHPLKQGLILMKMQNVIQSEKQISKIVFQLMVNSIFDKNIKNNRKQKIMRLFIDENNRDCHHWYTGIITKYYRCKTYFTGFTNIWTVKNKTKMD